MGKAKVERLSVDMLQDVVVNDGDVGTDGRGGGTGVEAETVGHWEPVHVIQEPLLGGWKHNGERLGGEVCVDCI